MKFSLVAALLVALAVVHGSDARTLMKRDVQSDIDQFTKILNDMSASITSNTQDLVERVKAMELTSNAQSFLEDRRVQFQPVMERVQGEAAKLQEQMKPLTDSLTAQMQPFSEQMESFFQQVMDQTKSLMPAQ